MRPRRAPLLVVVLVVGSSLLGACGDDVDDTTCADLTAMSAQERRDLLHDVAADAGSEAEAFLDASTDEQDAAVEMLVTACDDADGETTISDVLDPLAD